jgi:hypothetical protein
MTMTKVKRVLHAADIPKHIRLGAKLWIATVAGRRRVTVVGVQIRIAGESPKLESPLPPSINVAVVVDVEGVVGAGHTRVVGVDALYLAAEGTGTDARVNGEPTHGEPTHDAVSSGFRRGRPRAGTENRTLLATVRNYVVSEPGVWTPSSIAVDLDVPTASVRWVLRQLRGAQEVLPAAAPKYILWPMPKKNDSVP